MARLARDRVPLTVCPLSNVKLCVFPDLAHHPLPTLLDAGLCATVNSDDPAYFGGYIEPEFRADVRRASTARRGRLRAGAEQLHGELRGHGREAALV